VQATNYLWLHGTNLLRVRKNCSNRWARHSAVRGPKSVSKSPAARHWKASRRFKTLQAKALRVLVYVLPYWSSSMRKRYCTIISTSVGQSTLQLPVHPPVQSALLLASPMFRPFAPNCTFVSCNRWISCRPHQCGLGWICCHDTLS
jgi:hypothetical protein